MQVELPLSRYDFEYSVQDSVSLPSQSGVVWHSVLGKSLKDLSCISDDGDCQRCLFAHQCDYTQLFTGFRPENSEIMRKYNTVPAPHIIQTVLSDSSDYRQGDTLNIGLVLCGKANDKLPSLVRALFVAGMHGLGKSRSKVKLEKVTQSTGCGDAKSLLSGQKLLDAVPSQNALVSKAPQRFTLTFVTPYKPSGKADNGHGIDFGRLLMAIIRRVDLMQYFSTGVKLDVDFKALKSLTESIKVLDVDLDFHRSHRYSSAFGKVKDTSGFVGEVTFNLEQHEALWPFIVVCQSLNVGKNASMGFGRYVVGEAYA